MATQIQPDMVIATYRIIGISKGDNSAEPTKSSSSHLPDASSSQHNSTSIEPTRSFAHVTPPGHTTGKNRLTIHEPAQFIKNPQNFTHTAHVVFGHWTANFLCSYDAPSGILHNITLIAMNENMQKATGWRWDDEKRISTREEAVEEYRAMVKFGVHKKPISKSVGLCTLKEKDEAGWHFLELRMRGASLGGEEGRTETMVGLAAKKLVGGKDPLTESRGDDAGSKSKEEDAGEGDEEEEYKSFAESLSGLGEGPLFWNMLQRYPTEWTAGVKQSGK